MDQIHAARLPRPQRRALEREDEALLARALTRGDDDRALAAHVRRMVKLLRGAAAPSAEAIAHIGAVFDRSIPAPARKAIVCRSGCSPCCRQRVAVTAPEAFALAQIVRARTALTDAVTATDARTRGLDGKQRLAAETDCPLLVDQKCAVYPARPIACRGLTSLDVNGCIASFIHLKEIAFRAPVDYTTIATKCKLALCTALTIVGRPYAYYEMNAAVAIAAQEDKAEARWFAGEDVLAPAALNSVTPVGVAARIDLMAREIGATM